MSVKDYKEIFEYIRTQESFNDIIEKYQPYIVYLGGSRAINQENENSDYDLIAYCPKEKLSIWGYDNVRVTNDRGLSIHMMLLSFNQIVGMLVEENSVVTITKIFLGLIIGLGTKEEHIIYLKENEVHPMITFLAERRKEITELAVFHALTVHKWNIDTILEQAEMGMSYKIYYFLLTAHDIIFEENNKELIRKIKSKLKLDENESARLIAMFTKLKTFIEEYDDSKYDVLKMKLGVMLYGNDHI